MQNSSCGLRPHVDALGELMPFWQSLMDKA